MGFGSMPLLRCSTVFDLSLFCIPSQPLILTLLDITPMMASLHGVVMELQDCALTLLKGLHHT